MRGADPTPGPADDALRADPAAVRRLRRVVCLVAGLNLAYFAVEAAIAVAIGSVSLLADSVDFLEDTAVNLLIALSLGLPLARRALMGRVMALIICVPALAAAWQILAKLLQDGPEAPDPLSLVLTAGGAAAVNLLCTLILLRVRTHAGSMTAAAFLAARNDVLVNVAIIAMGLLTWATGSFWPDVVLGAVIVIVNLHAAAEVWEVAGQERLAARALAGEEID